jgi:hypothetical protein
MFPRQNRQNEIKIDMDDVDMIMGDNYGQIDKFLTSSFCRGCRSQTTIVRYTPFLDDVNDVILEGECIKCGSPIARYIETGASRKSASMAKHIRNVKSLSMQDSQGKS